MSTPSGCPCDAVVQLADTVKELKNISAEHEKRLAEGQTNFALIKQDLEYIKGNLDGKQKNHSSLANGVIISLVSAAFSFLVSLALARGGII